MVNQQPSKVDIAVCQESITTKRQSDSCMVWVTVGVLDLLFTYRFIFHVKKALSQSEQSRAQVGA